MALWQYDSLILADSLRPGVSRADLHLLCRDVLFSVVSYYEEKSCGVPLSFLNRSFARRIGRTFVPPMRGVAFYRLLTPLKVKQIGRGHFILPADVIRIATILSTQTDRESLPEVYRDFYPPDDFDLIYNGLIYTPGENSPREIRNSGRTFRGGPELAPRAILEMNAAIKVFLSSILNPPVEETVD